MASLPSPTARPLLPSSISLCLGLAGPRASNYPLPVRRACPVYGDTQGGEIGPVTNKDFVRFPCVPNYLIPSQFGHGLTAPFCF